MNYQMNNMGYVQDLIFPACRLLDQVSMLHQLEHYNENPLKKLVVLALQNHSVRHMIQVKESCDFQEVWI